MNTNTKDNKGKHVGHLAAWLYDRNYGWTHELCPDGIVCRFFTHVSDIYSGTPTQGSIARFDVAKSPRGIKAVNVELFVNRKEIAFTDTADALAAATPTASVAPTTDASAEVSK